MSITEIKSMTRSEQLLAMEMLWDELCHSGQEPESPPWHKEILETRQARMAEENASYLTTEDLKRKFRR